MPDTMVLLQFEHRNMTSLLGVLQQQITQMKRGAPVNFNVLTSALAYLSDYPDQCHHPKEDVVYGRLLDRHPHMAPNLKDLVAEHARLAALTRELGRAIDESRQNPEGTKQNLAHELDGFVDFYRQHMAMEEQYLFPAARKYLSSDDWADIDFAVFDRPDPLFEQDTEVRFRELRQEIMRVGAADSAAYREREETASLLAMQDVAAFNDAMRQHGDTLRLARSSQRGYQLERAGNVLARIPDCTESQAAWCAWFFWKGMAQHSSR
jgi:hemerythrin-like domain-containing protein